MKSAINLDSRPVLSTYARLSDLIGQEATTQIEAENNRRRGSGPRRPRQPKVGLVRIGRTSWFALVKAGVLPKPIKLGRSSLWNVADVLQALEQRGMK
jgi:hypothetical protein